MLFVADEDDAVRLSLSDEMRRRGLYCYSARFVRAVDSITAHRVRAALVRVGDATYPAWRVCQTIREKRPSLPILLLVGKGTGDASTYRCIDCVDYQMTFPCRPADIAEKIAGIYSERYEINVGKEAAYGFFTDISSRSVFIGSTRFKLSGTEFSIISCIIRLCPDYVTSAELYALCFGENVELQDENIPVHICHINQRARSAFGRPLIECRRGAGYRLIP